MQSRDCYEKPFHGANYVGIILKLSFSFPLANNLLVVGKKLNQVNFSNGTDREEKGVLGSLMGSPNFIDTRDGAYFDE